MKKNVKEKDIKAAPALWEVDLVENPQAIRIMTMKKKFVEQVRRLEPDEMKSIDGIIGLCEHRVLFVLKDKSIRFVHRLDVISEKVNSLVREQSVPVDAARQIAKQIVDGYPQVFVD